MRVAVTGAGGRLGSAIVKQLGDAGFVDEVLGWDLPEHDLDDPSSAERLVSASRPDAVVHCAAWTDVDGCARDPGLAMRRNGTAVAEIAEACVRVGAALIVISTNEVFDGLRTDGRPYRPTDRPNPANPYGAAKLAGEQAARAAFAANGDDFAAAALAVSAAPAVPAALAAGAAIGPTHALAIVRTAWLFGLPGSDFPHKILAAAARARDENRSLALVADETGSPTYSPDLAAAIVRLMAEAARPGGRGFGGIHHVVNGGHASRAVWAREVLRLGGMDVDTNDVPLSTWPRPSTPPLWGVIEATPVPGGPLRDWHEALAEYIGQLAANAQASR
jgi:dTDP-4-dehydrorhamnose reductase